MPAVPALPAPPAVSAPPVPVLSAVTSLPAAPVQGAFTSPSYSFALPRDAPQSMGMKTTPKVHPPLNQLVLLDPDIPDYKLPRFRLKVVPKDFTKGTNYLLRALLGNDLQRFSLTGRSKSGSKVQIPELLVVAITSKCCFCFCFCFVCLHRVTCRRLPPQTVGR